MTKKNELCPFCGNSEIGVGYNDKEIGPSKWRAVCYSCGAHGPYCNTNIEALDAWNHRFATDTNVVSKERTAKVTDTWIVAGYDELNAWCPVCEHRITRGCSFCPTCGVKLEWSGNE